MNKIAILIPSLKKGGAEKQACLLASALKDKNDVILIVLSPEAGLEDENLKLSDLSPENIYALEGGTIKKLFLLHSILRKRNIDIMFCYLTKPDFWGPIIGRVAGVRYIYQGLRNAKLPKFKMLLEFFGNLLATGAITNNYAGADVFRRNGIRNQIVIPNCYLHPQVAIKRGENEIITIITVGRFVEQKDYPTAIASVAAAMKEDDRIRFKIIGHGELEKHVRGLIDYYGIGDKTEILINPKGIMRHLIDADIYLSTSLFEGTSNSIMEAMDASLPVIATSVGDNDRLIVDGVDGYLTRVGEVELLTQYILRLCNSNSLRSKLGMAGNQILKDNYSFEIFQRRYLDLIASLH